MATPRYARSQMSLRACALGYALGVALIQPASAQAQDEPVPEAEAPEGDADGVGGTTEDTDHDAVSEPESVDEPADDEVVEPPPRRTPMGAPVYKRLGSGAAVGKSSSATQPVDDPASRVVRPPLLQRNPNAPPVELHTRGNTTLLSNIPARVAEFKSQARQARDDAVAKLALEDSASSLDSPSLGADLRRESEGTGERKDSGPYWAVRVLLALMAIVAIGIAIVLWLGSRRPNRGVGGA